MLLLVYLASGPHATLPETSEHPFSQGKSQRTYSQEESELAALPAFPTTSHATAFRNVPGGVKCPRLARNRIPYRHSSSSSLQGPDRGLSLSLSLRPHLPRDQALSPQGSGGFQRRTYPQLALHWAQSPFTVSGHRGPPLEEAVAGRGNSARRSRPGIETTTGPETSLTSPVSLPHTGSQSPRGLAW